MFQAIEEGIDQRLFLEEIIPFGVIQVRCNDCGFFPVSFPHEFKEGIDLFWFEGQVPEFVDQQQIVAAEAAEEFWGGGIGQRGVELIEEVLGVGEAAAVAGE